ncbi:MAG: UDP-3-O-(3-hydroxymyristoyl)glucosamine N-acyltransferase, partial [Sulfurimonadaceae bacterium]|nr:UDP-3-O-(3-hydroxymyristoyl)glucosamine N-acyltransferase [Sulfurimonadaceae bacterium]
MITLETIAQTCGIACDDGSAVIKGINTLKDATPEEISFLDNPKYVNDLADTKAAAVFVSEKMADKVPAGTIALVDNEPYLKMALATKLFAPSLVDDDAPEAVMGEGTYVAETATIAKGAVVGKNCTIMPGVYIGARAVVGDNTLLHANAVVYHDCKVGSDCIIHSGAAIGTDGFGFAHTKLGEHVKIYQNGNVVIEDDVELGGNVSIDRAVFSSTVIKKGAKLDNLVHIGHNCVIGEYSILTGQVGLSGSTILGRNVVMGGQSATAGHLEVAPFTTLAARSGVTKSITEPNKTFAGF